MVSIGTVTQTCAFEWRGGRSQGSNWGKLGKIPFVSLILIISELVWWVFALAEFSGEDYMDKKILGLVGAVSALAMMTAVETAQARQVTEVLNARSYAELLQPIPNAVALLMAADFDERDARKDRERAKFERATRAIPSPPPPSSSPSSLPQVSPPSLVPSSSSSSPSLLLMMTVPTVRRRFRLRKMTAVA